MHYARCWMLDVGCGMWDVMWDVECWMRCGVYCVDRDLHLSKILEPELLRHDLSPLGVEQLARSLA
eukprot:2242772-Rhodomonas_salina.3